MTSTPTRYAAYYSDEKAIRAATQAARDEACNMGVAVTHDVLLRGGDTLRITAKPGRSRTSHTREGGWRTCGLLHIGPVAARVMGVTMTVPAAAAE